MNKPTYRVEIEDENIFSFLSIGKNGIILKMVEIVEIQEGIYNLGFGDYNFATNSVDDKANSNNGDIEKVLATIFGIMINFLEKNPNKTIFFSGSTPLRTQFYQRIVNTYFDEFSTILEIQGNREGEYEPFQKNREYESFFSQKTVLI
jgi:hypothetical protein